MQIHRIFFFMLASLFVMRMQSAAQATGDTARLFAEMDRLHRTMRAVPVSFNIRYTYTSERNSSVILDSLSGQIELSGASSRYRMDRTETISNERYNIILFRDDKLIYLTSPHQNQVSDPLLQLRMMMSGSAISHCIVKEEKELLTISLRFKEGTGYREMNMHVDRKSGYIKDATYVLKTELMMGAEQQAGQDIISEYGEYAVIRVVFSEYRHLTGSTAWSDERNYFTREGDVFKPAPAYADYTIFNGSPNL